MPCDNIEFYNKRREELMNRWIARYKAANGIRSFAKDGIISPEIWFSNKCGKERILFILKEAYDDIEHRIWDEAGWIAHRKCMENCGNDCSSCRATGSTFNPLAEWIYGINRAGAGEAAEYDNWLGVSDRNLKRYYEKRDELLCRTALINIKKPDGCRVSDTDELYWYASADKDLLTEQIALINPTLIICGGTYNIFRCIYTELPKLADPSDGFAVLGDIKIIACCHPNARSMSNEHKYYSVLKNYNKLRAI